MSKDKNKNELSEEKSMSNLGYRYRIQTVNNICDFEEIECVARSRNKKKSNYDRKTENDLHSKGNPRKIESKLKGVKCEYQQQDANENDFNEKSRGANNILYSTEAGLSMTSSQFNQFSEQCVSAENLNSLQPKLTFSMLNFPKTTDSLLDAFRLLFYDDTEEQFMVMQLVTFVKTSLSFTVIFNIISYLSNAFQSEKYKIVTRMRSHRTSPYLSELLSIIIVVYALKRYSQIRNKQSLE